MEREGQTAPLCDFLYRDAARIASYYAQIFGGHLTALEETDANRWAKEGGGGLNLLAVSGSGKAISETASGAKRVINPHDVITTDVIRRLLQDERISRKLSTASHGALVLVKGTIAFFDRLVMELAAAGLEAAMNAEKKKKPQQRNREMIQGMEFLIPFFSKLSIPSVFFLRTPETDLAVGTIKEEGLEEPISSYNAKHGAAGLSDVFLLGIKEQATEAIDLPETQYTVAGRQAAQALSELIFPKSALRVTPIALYRQV